MDELNEEERAMVGLVREFVDRDVRSVVREPAHSGISIVPAEPGPGFIVSQDLPKLGYKHPAAS